MRARYHTVESDAVYFMTVTIVEWFPVFCNNDVNSIIINASTYCRENKGLRIFAWVLMDNHPHLVAEGPELPRIIQAFKRHTARKIIAYAATSNKAWLLNPAFCW
jgi:putative transposase